MAVASQHAIGYLRVSTDSQAESGLGLEAQRAAIVGAAARLGVGVAEVFTDAGVSGGLALEARAGLLKAVSALHRGSTLLVAKRDRVGRDVIAVAMIERLVQKKGARLVSAAGEGTESDDPAAVLMRRLVDCFASYERMLIAARTKAALRAKRARGERTGRFAPFGFRLSADGRLETEPAEVETIGRIRSLRDRGLSLQAIAGALNAEGSRTRSGQPWRFEYVRNVIKQVA